MRGCKYTMLSTARNDSWKPTSATRNGFQTNRPKAATPSVLNIESCRLQARPIMIIVNMTVARSTDADSPVRKA